LTSSSGAKEIKMEKNPVTTNVGATLLSVRFTETFLEKKSTLGGAAALIE